MTKPLPLKRGAGPKRTPHQQGECPRCRKGTLTPSRGVVESFGAPHRAHVCSNEKCDYTELRPK